MSKEKIISYIYGEMTDTDKKAFEKEMEENLGLANEVNGMMDVRSVLSSDTDLEPIIQPIIIPEKKSSIRIPRWFYLAAASVLLLLTIGKLFDFRVVATDQEWALQFGEKVEKKQDAPKENYVTTDDLENLTDQLRILTAQIASNHEMQNEAIDKIKMGTEKSRKEMLSYINQKPEKAAFDKDDLQEMFTDQKNYTDEIVQELIEYMDFRRQEDLRLINKGLSDLAFIVQNNGEIRPSLAYESKAK